MDAILSTIPYKDATITAGATSRGYLRFFLNAAPLIPIGKISHSISHLRGANLFNLYGFQIVGKFIFLYRKLSGGGKTEIPGSYRCPISHDLFFDPVFAADGHTYEREKIEEWLENHDTSPLTNEQLNREILIPNNALRSAIDEFLNTNPEAFSESYAIELCKSYIENQQIEDLRALIEKERRLLQAYYEMEGHDEFVNLLEYCIHAPIPVLKCVLALFPQPPTLAFEWFLIAASDSDYGLTRLGLLFSFINTDPTEHIVYAIEGGSLKYLQAAIKAGANIDVQNGFFLHLAISHNETQIVEELVKEGIDIQSKNQDGLTPLELARQLNHSEIIEILSPDSACPSKDIAKTHEPPQESQSSQSEKQLIEIFEKIHSEQEEKFAKIGCRFDRMQVELELNTFRSKSNRSTISIVSEDLASLSEQVGAMAEKIEELTRENQRLRAMISSASASPAVGVSSTSRKAEKYGHVNAEIFSEFEWAKYVGTVEGDIPLLSQKLINYMGQPCPFTNGSLVRHTHVVMLMPSKVDGREIQTGTILEILKNKSNECNFPGIDRCHITLTETPSRRNFWIVAPKKLFTPRQVLRTIPDKPIGNPELVKQWEEKYSNYKPTERSYGGACWYLEATYGYSRVSMRTVFALHLYNFFTNKQPFVEGTVAFTHNGDWCYSDFRKNHRSSGYYPTRLLDDGKRRRGYQVSEPIGFIIRKKFNASLK